jgi:hypothetical protein
MREALADNDRALGEPLIRIYDRQAYLVGCDCKCNYEPDEGAIWHAPAPVPGRTGFEARTDACQQDIDKRC